MNIRVAITDDHPMILQGLQTVLARYDHISVTATYQTAGELLDGLAIQQPDVLLLDLHLPDKTGDEMVPSIKQQYPDIRILILTNFDSVLYASKMLYQGVQGYLLKTSSEEVMVAAIEKVFEGGQFVEQGLLDKIELDPMRSNKLYTASTSLTTREKEVLQLIVNGQTDREISNALFLGLHTIKHYRMSILLKLDVKNTAALVNKALKMGLAE